MPPRRLLAIFDSSRLLYCFHDIHRDTLSEIFARLFDWTFFEYCADLAWRLSKYAEGHLEYLINIVRLDSTLWVFYIWVLNLGKDPFVTTKQDSTREVS